VKILIVEDSEQDAKLTTKALGRAGYAGVEQVFVSGEDLVQAIREHDLTHPECMSKGVALVILDFNLPGMSGLDILQFLRSNECFRYTPIVMLTSTTDVEKVRACYAAGANSFIHKSVDFGDFIATVGQVADYWIGVNEIVEK
jgi:CheY-like chemotaxis protein